MEYGASETGPETPRRDENLRLAEEDVGRKDFMFGVTGVSLMVIVAIAFAIFA
jgi:hypothetical protein